MDCYEKLNYIVFHVVHGTKGPWYEQSMVRIVNGTKSLVIQLVFSLLDVLMSLEDLLIMPT